MSEARSRSEGRGALFAGFAGAVALGWAALLGQRWRERAPAAGVSRPDAGRARAAGVAGTAAPAEASRDPRDPQDDPALRAEQERRLHATWARPRGLAVLTEVNNDFIGTLYIGTAFVFLLFAGALGLILRAQLATPGAEVVSPHLYNQMMSLHGSAMMFLVAVPMFEAVAVLLMPQMIGARDLPFPRLSAFGYWCYLIGGVFVCSSLFFGAAPSGGWFMYPPLTTDPRFSGIGSDVWLLGLSFIEVAAIAAAIELIVGVLKCRAPGMRLNIMPLYAWYVLVVAIMILFAFPPLLAGDLLFELERGLNWPFFDPARGGDPVLWQHLFWIFGHPEVYIVFLPAIALSAMIVPTFARRPIYGYVFIVLAAVGTGFLSFGLWVHHMFATGLPSISLAVFSAASEAVAIPTAVQIACFVATLALGRVTMSVPLLFVIGGLGIFIVGGLTGVMVALAPFDFQAHDTYFIVAHLHYVLIGGMLFPTLAGVYYYFPLIFARRLSDRAGRVAFWLMLVGFNVAFLPMHWTGLRGMPRRVATYPEGIGFDTLNLVSTIGAAILGLGVAVLALDVIRCALGGGRPAGRNPWGAGTLEWIGERGGGNWGVRSVPIVSSRYPLWDDPDMARKHDEGRYFLPDAEEGKRELLVTSMLDARPVQCLRVPGPSLLPLLAAVALGGLFILPVFKLYGAALVSGACALAIILVWLWTGTVVPPEKPAKAVGHGIVLPLHVSGSRSVGWWAMLITMIASTSAFASLVFAYLFYWTVHPAWPPPGFAGPSLGWPALGASAGLGAWLLVLLARAANASGRATRTAALLGLAALAAGLCAAALLAGPWLDGFDPTLHAYTAIIHALVLWTGGHVLVGAVMQLYASARALAGRLTAELDTDLRVTSVFWHVTAPTVVATAALVALFPWVAR